MINKIPFLITLLSMILGVFIAILFGANEGIFKEKIARDILLNEKVMSMADYSAREAKIKKEEAKNWRYYQRFHFHSTGISAMALGLLLLLSFSMGPCRLKMYSSYLISVGGFLYPYVWLLSAIYGPVIGRSEAKEAFAVLGYMGGVYLAGLLLAFFTLLRYPVKFKSTQ